ncbi:MAG TPA: ABC transporter ATP-binding protein [Spirillospora sp.]
MLAVDGLCVGYTGAERALEGLSFEVGEDDVVAVLGANGAGKTTLLRAISGTLPMHRGRVTAGTIRYRGRPLPGSPRGVVAAGVVQVPEGRRIFGRLTVEENLAIGGFVRRRGKETKKARDRVFELFPELKDRAGQRGSLLSGGEQQMLAIGRGLMASPRLLMLDEPTLGLAPLMVRRIGEVIRDIGEQGTTVLLVEQNAMALRVATRAVVLEAGVAVAQGTTAELAEHDLAARYLGAAGPATRPAPGAAGGRSS